MKMKDSNFIINVEVAIHCNNKWLIIKRSDEEDHAPGISILGVVGWLNKHTE